MREPYGYKEFKVEEVMNVSRGNDITKKELSKIEGGDVRYIKARRTNNGIETYVDIEPQEDLAITISDVGTMGVVFLQNRPFYASGNNTYAVMKEVEDTENKLLYMGSVINKRFQHLEGTYGRLGLGKLRDTKVLLPITPEGTPDYEYMEDYITYIKGGYVDKLEESHREDYHQLEALGLDEGAIELEEPYGHEYINVGEMFKVTGTKSTNAGNLVFSEEGINFVGRTAIDNGVQGKVEELEYEPNEGNTITISQVGTMVANYQEEPYYTSQNIAKVYTEELTKRQNLYITSVINKHLIRYEGYVTPKLIDIKGFDFKLPITPEGTPDYDYMENYIKHIAYTYRMNRRDEQEEEIRKLRELVQ